jgi:hypothetical protein
MRPSIARLLATGGGVKELEEMYVDEVCLYKTGYLPLDKGSAGMFVMHRCRCPEGNKEQEPLRDTRVLPVTHPTRILSKNVLHNSKSYIDFWNEFSHAFFPRLLPQYALSTKRAVSGGSPGLMLRLVVSIGHKMVWLWSRSAVANAVQSWAETQRG